MLGHSRSLEMNQSIDCLRVPQ